MTVEQFLQFANALSEAVLLVAADGRVLAANRGAGRRAGVPPEAMQGRRLVEFLTTAPEVLEPYLRSCSRSRDPLPGALILARGDGRALPCRVEGALLRPRSGTEPAWLLLKLIPREELSDPFAILTRRIAELTREVARRKRVEAELRAHREWLRVTLASIGDAVMATDEAGCITFTNFVAQFLTGWREEDAIGRPLDQVFRIVNEETRERAESPVAQVLRDGKIVGLAKQTILISRDGQEYPIDDSAAPIQEDGGRILGIVLVFREVSERRRMERELRDRAEALAAAAQRRDQFLAMLAHELRNPLAPIRNAVQLLKQEGPDEPRLIRAREMIDRQVGHQARMIDDLLEVTRVTQGRIRLRLERVDLALLVEQAAEEYRSVAEGAGLTLSLEGAPGPIWVEGDPTRLHQVLSNLLGNAIKFTDRGGAVTLRADAESGRARFTVRDTGIGIEPEALPHIFEVFAQADRSLERTRGGLGLGLALVRGLVALHGGEVRAASGGSGQGTVMTVLLPLAASPAPAGPLSPSPAPAPRRVLILEDNRDAADSLRELLELAGHTVAVAYSGPEGVERARRFLPHVVFCDLGLPGMDGYQVARELRNEPATREARLILVSGYSGEEHRRRAEEVGFDNLLTKPVEFEAILRLL